VEKEVKKEVKKVELEAKKELKEVKKEAKKELKEVTQEKDRIQELLYKVIENQTQSKHRDVMNIIFWVICFGLLLFDAIKGA